MKRSRLAAGLMAAVVLLAALLCLCALSCAPGGGDDTSTESLKALSVELLSDVEASEDMQEDTQEEDQPVEAKRWVRVTFDVAVIALSVGIIVLAWWAVKKVTKKYGGRGRRFG